MFHGRMLFAVAFYLDLMLFRRLEFFLSDSWAFSEGSGLSDLRCFSFILGPFGILASESSFNVNWPPGAATGPTFFVKLCHGHIVPHRKFDRIGGTSSPTFPNVKYVAPREICIERNCFDRPNAK